MRWRTQEPAHVQEYIEPAFVEHDTTNKSLPDQLRDGDLPAAVMGMDLPDDPTFAPLIPDPEAADRASYVRLGFMPINHMVAVSVRAAKRAPEAIRLAYRLLAKGIEESDLPQGAPRSAVADYDAVEASTAYAIEEAYRQHLIPARISVKDLFQHSRRLLNI